MADYYERTVLEHYQLKSPFPTEWPSDKDESDGSDDDEAALKKRIGAIRRSKSRYSALEQAASGRRSLVPGSQKTGEGLENLVQKDEPDPLGSGESVVRILRAQGLPVQDDIRLRKMHPLPGQRPTTLTCATKEIDIYSHLPLSLPRCSFHKFTAQTLRNNYFVDSMFCRARLIRSLLP